MLAFIGTEDTAMLPVSAVRLNSTSATAFAMTVTHFSSGRTNPSSSTWTEWLPTSIPEMVQGVTPSAFSSSI
ncbi:hypothetical protein DSECCO2_622620 [anaerobic digester metagenome]